MAVASPFAPRAPLDERVRRAQPSPGARQVLNTQKAEAASEGAFPNPLADVLQAVRDQGKNGRVQNELLRCLLRVMEENFGLPDDQQVWLPFAFNVPAGNQVVVSAVVDQNTTFYYRGYGAEEQAGVSFIEVIDGVQGAEHFVPPARANDTGAWPYGLKGRRALSRVDLVVSNANAAPVTVDGWFAGRFRLGAR